MRCCSRVHAFCQDFSSCRWPRHVARVCVCTCLLCPFKFVWKKRAEDDDVGSEFLITHGANMSRAPCPFREEPERILRERWQPLLAANPRPPQRCLCWLCHGRLTDFVSRVDFGPPRSLCSVWRSVQVRRIWIMRRVGPFRRGRQKRVVPVSPPLAVAGLPAVLPAS